MTSVALCPVCGRRGELAPGPGGRPAASCRGCGSLERHRALPGVLRALEPFVACGPVLADIAPTPHIHDRLARMAQGRGVRYVGIDFDPGADRRKVDVQASLTELPLADGVVGLMMCYHVLEHVPDDGAAMREIRRVLSPDGVAMIQVPWRQGVGTDEDPDAPVAERVRRFGQADHVRYYGDDFEDRLRAAGLTLTRLEMRGLYGAEVCGHLGLNPEEPVWLATTGRQVDVDSIREDALRAVVEATLGVLDEHADRLVQLSRERDEARARVKRLRGRVSRLSEREERRSTEFEAFRARPEVRAVTGVRRAAGRTRRLLAGRSQA